MTDFLLELRSEEIPARMQDKAREDLARLFAAELDKAGLKPAALETFATPRRLALIARDLPGETAAVSEETKGPKTGAPPQALEGFLRKTGLTQDQLVERDGVYFAVIDKPGRATADVLAEAIPAIIRAFPWPKSMRWGDASASTESLKWVRPLQGIVALLGSDVVECEVSGIASGRATKGHRFQGDGEIELLTADHGHYLMMLAGDKVIVDQDARKRIIRDRAQALAAEAGLELIADEGLVVENAGLTEWPVPLLGRFDAAFLDVPPEVIQLTARVNQKYFVCRDGAGKLANAFICTANIDAADGGAKIVEGNRKVLAARLSDAKFFYETDLKVPLDDQARKLDRIVFHEKLGTVADKVERVAKLARWLVEERIVSDKPLPFRGGVGGGAAPQNQPSDPADRPHPNPSPQGEGLKELAALAERAARLCKADLVTGMVGEFPELQGLMGGYYAAAQGEDPAVAAAIRDHYKPVGQGDDVPTDPVTVAVSLADKLDTLFSFFVIQEVPTGSRDPFALRRAAIGVIAILLRLSIRLPLTRWTYESFVQRVMQQMRKFDFSDLPQLRGMQGKKVTFQSIDDGIRVVADGVAFAEIAYPNATAMKQSKALTEMQDPTRPLIDFFADRLKVQQREAGVRHDLIDAVFALGGEDDLVRLLARVHALQAFIGTADGANLLAGYKRAANILKKEGYEAPRAPAKAGALDAEARHDPALRPSPEHGGAKNPLSYTPEIAEAALIAALDAAEPAAANAVAREDFEAAMAALATLRAPIDAFFETVIVNDPDADKRAARLALLARVRDAVHSVADFSKIEG